MSAYRSLDASFGTGKLLARPGCGMPRGISGRSMHGATRRERPGHLRGFSGGALALTRGALWDSSMWARPVEPGGPDSRALSQAEATVTMQNSREALAGRWKGAFLLAALAFLCAPLPGGAQYFGRNKVQYDKFEFSV